MIRLVLMVVLICLSTGCAYMINGGRQDVSFETNPKEADIRSNGKFVGTGSAVTSVDRSASQNIVVSATGYEDAHIYLNKKMNAAWAFWDIATCVVPVTLCIPVLVDAISGAWNGYEDHYPVKLIPTKRVAQPAPIPTPTLPPQPAPAVVLPQQPTEIE